MSRDGGRRFYRIAYLRGETAAEAEIRKAEKECAGCSAHNQGGGERITMTVLAEMTILLLKKTVQPVPSENKPQRAAFSCGNPLEGKLAGI